MMIEAALPPYLTDAEIADICAPLRMPAAQRRYLARLGLVVQAKPNGRPLVARAEFDRVLVGRAPEAKAQNAGPGRPNEAALLQIIQGGRRGSKAQGR